MAEPPIHITLRYRGPAVDDGTMPVEDVIEALQGFSGAYGKIASSLLPTSTHELRIESVRQGSFELNVLGWVEAAMPTALTVMSGWNTASKAAKSVYSVLKGFIDARKHTQGEQFRLEVSGSHNTTMVVNFNGESQPVPREVIDLLKSGLIDKEVERIAAPLNEGLIDYAEISASGDGETLDTSITSAEKRFFTEKTGETTQKVEITGKLISLNKETHRGILQKNNGERVKYHYVGKAPDRFHSHFAHVGPLKLQCIAYFDGSLNLTRLDVLDATQLQTELQFGIDGPKILKDPRPGHRRIKDST